MTNEELNKKRGQRLKECRELRKITQNELAMLSHCSPQSISYIENGRRGMSRDLAHIFAKELKIKEEYILLESDFKTDSEKVKHEEDIMNAIDNSAFKYLTSLGYKITFSAFAAEDEALLHIENDVFKISSKNYGNDLLFSMDGAQVLMEDAKVRINNIEISLIDYYDFLDDLNEYANFLISQLKNRVERRIKHIGVHYEEEERKHNETLEGRLEMFIKDFPELSKENLLNLKTENSSVER